MARRLRIQYPGALYHIYNRGNYRRDVFENVGAAQAFEAALGETCDLHEWRIHSYVIMRNHFHLALETPQPNLATGMHWLQSTFATRFNRLRKENGHLFQGRYQSPLVEDFATLFRVINYIHLNPVQACLVSPQGVATFRWSSLSRFVRGSAPPWLRAEKLLAQLQLDNNSHGWSRYAMFLAELAVNSETQAKMESEFMARGWAIGTSGWKRAVAKEHARLALEPGLEGSRLREISELRWREALDGALREAAKTSSDLEQEPRGARWKVEVATQLRRNVGAPYSWLAKALHMGSSAAVRAQVFRHRNKIERRTA
jgi:REP element-mobilizing transposase RayT